MKDNNKIKISNLSNLSFREKGFEAGRCQLCTELEFTVTLKNLIV